MLAHRGVDDGTVFLAVEADDVHAHAHDVLAAATGGAQSHPAFGGQYRFDPAHAYASSNELLVDRKAAAAHVS
ncbi:MAG: hypothetical protein ABI574_04085 [Burkholderiales bacterium]